MAKEIAKRGASKAAAPKPRTLEVRENTKGIDYDKTLNAVLQYTDIANSIKNIGAIEPAAQYVVDIPVEYREAFANNELQLMENATTHVKRPILMRVLPQGKQEIVSQLTVHEENMIVGNPLRDIAQGFQNLQTRQQLAALAEETEKIHKGVSRIEQGQKDDRVGTLMGAWNLLECAMQIEDAERRAIDIEAAKQQLFTARGQLGNALKTSIENFEPVMENSIRRKLKIFHDDRYLTDADMRRYRIEQDYRIFLNATNMCAVSCMLSGDYMAAKKVYEQSKEILTHIDMRNFATIVYARPDIPLFYKAIPQDIAKEKKKLFAHMKSLKQYEYVRMHVKGKVLLEAAKYGEKQEETKA